MLIENAIKHNEISDIHPLTIRLTNDQDYLVVENNIKLISTENNSTKIGQKNIIKRYKITSNLLYKWQVLLNWVYLFLD